MTEARALPRKRVLLVEDDPVIQKILKDRLVELGATVSVAGSVELGLQGLLANPDLILLDVQLSDGSGLTIAEEARKLHPIPHIIAMSGTATSGQSFRLAKLHVLHYLPKPFGLKQLDQALANVPDAQENLAASSALAVGDLGLLQAQDIVRDVMTQTALASTEGNVTRAAEILGISRQALQQANRPEQKKRPKT